MEIKDKLLLPVSTETSKDIVQLMLKNLLTEAKTSKESKIDTNNSFSMTEEIRKLSGIPGIKETVYCNTVDFSTTIKNVKEHGNISHTNKNKTRDPNIKVEPKTEDFKTENVKFNWENHSENLCVMAKLRKLISLDHSYSTYDYDTWLSSYSIKNVEIISDDEEDHEFALTERRIKFEEVNIKEENMEQSETSVPSNSTAQTLEISTLLKCHQSDYATLQTSSLEIPFLKSKDSEKMFKCSRCNFQTIDKGQLRVHLVKHKSPKQIVKKSKFRCDLCHYRTDSTSHLKRHLLRHKHPEEIERFKCNHCNFRTVSKYYLKKHIIHHKNTKDVRKFKCDQCDFQTIYKSNLKTHLLRHKNSEECKWFMCDHCNFETVSKYNLKKHFLRHKKNRKNLRDLNAMNTR